MMMCMRKCIPTVIDKWLVAWRMLMLPFQKGLRRNKSLIEEDEELGVLWKKPYQEKRSLIRLQFHNILVVPMSSVLIDTTNIAYILTPFSFDSCYVFE
ncbi:hypothetical protein FF2_003314 [Malus domestica]